ncbi:MAG TPA: hypothetical protein VGB63_14070 [Pedobacter sp.]|jgi:hypothetical protein
MKKSIYLFAILLAYFLPANAQKITLTKVWESDTTLRTAESVLLDRKTNYLYVSCINGKPSLENQGSFIAKVDQKGKVLKLKFTEGLNSIKGMGISGDKLYVTEMTNVVEIALSSGKILKRYAVTGAQFLNDITVDPKTGIVYISDSATSKIWTLKKGVIDLFTEGSPLQGINGLLIENNQLLIGNGDGTLYSINLSNKKLVTIAKVSGGIDGIITFGNKKYIVSEWHGKVWSIGSTGNTQLLFDTVKEKINSADIEYNPKTQVLYVPTFFTNTVRAYNVKFVWAKK